MRTLTLLMAAGALTAAGRQGSVDGTAEEIFRTPANLVHYIQGEVFRDGKQLSEARMAATGEWKPGETLKSGLGLAEVMLAPGAVLRMAENTAVKLVEATRERTVIDIAAGAVAIEVLDSRAGLLLVRNGEASVAIGKPGFYRIGGEPAEVRVYDGSATVSRGSLRKVLAAGTLLPLDGTALAGRLDPSKTDPLIRWSKRRGQLLAVANLASARAIHSSQIPFRQSSWWWNADHGVLTFVPARNQSCGWAGYCHASPSLMGRRGATQPVSGVAYTSSPAAEPEPGDKK